jgi:hypothetical protein
MWPYLSSTSGMERRLVTDNEMSQLVQHCGRQGVCRWTSGGHVHRILRSYTQQMPTKLYPPVNYQMYKPLHNIERAFRREAPSNDVQQDRGNGKVSGVVAASMAGTVLAGVAVAQSMELLHLPPSPSSLL